LICCFAANRQSTRSIGGATTDLLVFSMLMLDGAAHPTPEGDRDPGAAAVSVATRPRTGARGLKMEIAAFRFSGGPAAGWFAALLASL
jgi:hypothetical protein